jgi:probable F420-dependent oxidoreductase
MSRTGWRDAVREVESLGYSTLTVMDHFSSGGIWGALVAAHEAAPSLRLGTLVANGDLWNPSLLAREALLVDALTDGRFELGVGAGWSVEDYQAAGVDRDPASERVERLAEAVQVFGQAFRGEAVRVNGAYYSIDGGQPWPRRDGAAIPLLVGGGARPILEIAAQYADIVSIHRNLEHGVAASWSDDLRDHGQYQDAVARRVAWVRSVAGERFPSLQLHAIVLRAEVTDRREEVARAIAESHALPVERLLASPHYLIGTVEEIVRDLLERRERWGISYWTLVPGNDLRAFAPVVETLQSR